MIETIFLHDEVDILLIAEGTYPYVRGGVASWIYDLISFMPQTKFGIIFIGAYKELYKDFAYPLPENLVYLQNLYLFSEELEEPESMTKKLPLTDIEALENIRQMHAIFQKSHTCPHALTEAVPDIGEMMIKFDYRQFLRGEDSWEYISGEYNKHSTDPSFLNYFWNIRNIHAPLWRLEKIIDQAPRARLVHTISTGYAGLLAVMLHQRFAWPLLLSEHGLYTKERDLELLHSAMFANVETLTSQNKAFSYQHQVWINFFDSLARMCYFYAEKIVSLYGGAQKYQIYAGAPREKTLIIPNGVDIPRFAAVRRPPMAAIPKIVCFVGRFLRFKDIKTFIRSVSIMQALDPQIVARIKVVGEPDELYMQECMEYIDILGLKERIFFLKEGGMLDILASTGLLILSSISEGMPLVILESMAAGIPIIATDAGACREIIEGRDTEDKLLGACGTVVSIVNANKIAEAVVDMLNNPDKWRAAQRACIARVEKYYNINDMIRAYENLYP